MNETDGSLGQVSSPPYYLVRVKTERPIEMVNVITLSGFYVTYSNISDPVSTIATKHTKLKHHNALLPILK